jgi:6-phosphogluconolactonase
MTAEEPDPTMVYVSSAGTREVIAFTLDSRTGALALHAKTKVPGPNGPSPTSMPMALSPDGGHLYVAVRTAPFPVSTFSIDPVTGALGFVATALLVDEMAYIAADRSGQYLFAASYTGAKLTVNPIAPNGAVEAPALQIVRTPPKAHCILPDLTNKRVFATSLGGDVVLQNKFDAATGMLVANEPAFVRTRLKAGPRHLAFNPDGRSLYVLNELNGSINGYVLDLDSGTLDENQCIALLPPDIRTSPSAADLHVTPDGRFLYASERATHKIYAFAIDEDFGKLRGIGSFPTEPSPRGFNITPCGRYLVAAGQLSNRMRAYAIDARDGKLTGGATIRAGSNPNWIEIVRLATPGARERDKSAMRLQAP